MVGSWISILHVLSQFISHNEQQSIYCDCRFLHATDTEAQTGS